MEPVIFSKKSWGYKLLCFLNSRSKYFPPEDICEYRTRLIMHSLKALFFTTIVTFFIIFLGTGALQLVDHLFNFHTFELVKNLPIFYKIVITIFAGIILAGLILLIFLGVVWVGAKWEDYRYDRRNRRDTNTYKEPQLVSMYKSWKEKVCYPIIWKNENTKD